jgi:xanthine dehydrogenase small subunit
MPNAARDYILLYLNGRPVRVAGDDAFLTLSDLLRRRQRLTGTKVVCAEGDCGSCAVLVGRPTRGGRDDRDAGTDATETDAAGGMTYAAVTSCIQLAFQLDGAHVVTVEGLKDGQALNPIQQSMVACHGAQCGFCTPGFVVSLYGMMQDGRPADAASVTRELVGNLCRCTGYDAIVRAALATDRSALKPIDALYPPGPIAAALAAAAAESVEIRTPTRRLYKPANLAAACRFRRENPDCVVVAGGTDMGVVYNKRMRAIDVALSVGGLPELRGVRLEPTGAGHGANGDTNGDGDGNGNATSASRVLYVGAAEPLSALERAAREHLPELGKFMAWFGSPLIKNAGTIGGNLVTGSPIGDTLPALIALEAEIEIAGLATDRGDGDNSSGTDSVAHRRVPIGAFYTGYRKTVLAPGELVVGVRLPIPRAGDVYRLYKISRRKDLDISTFGAAVWMRIEGGTGEGGTVADVRLAFGGVGPMVLRMARTEAALRGGPAALEAFERAGEVAATEVTPISDVRGSEAYRRTLARNLLLKVWHDAVGGDAAPPDDDFAGNGNRHAGV